MSERDFDDFDYRDAVSDALEFAVHERRSSWDVLPKWMGLDDQLRAENHKNLLQLYKKTHSWRKESFDDFLNTCLIGAYEEIVALEELRDDYRDESKDQVTSSVIGRNPDFMLYELATAITEWHLIAMHELFCILQENFDNLNQAQCRYLIFLSMKFMPAEEIHSLISQYGALYWTDVALLSQFGISFPEERSVELGGKRQKLRDIISNAISVQGLSKEELFLSSKALASLCNPYSRTEIKQYKDYLAQMTNIDPWAASEYLGDNYYSQNQIDLAIESYKVAFEKGQRKISIKIAYLYFSAGNKLESMRWIHEAKLDNTPGVNYLELQYLLKYEDKKRPVVANRIRLLRRASMRDNTYFFGEFDKSYRDKFLWETWNNPISYMERQAVLAVEWNNLASMEKIFDYIIDSYPLYSEWSIGHSTNILWIAENVCTSFRAKDLDTRSSQTINHALSLIRSANFILIDEKKVNTTAFKLVREAFFHITLMLINYIGRHQFLWSDIANSAKKLYRVNKLFWHHILAKRIQDIFSTTKWNISWENELDLATEQYKAEIADTLTGENIEWTDLTTLILHNILEDWTVEYSNSRIGAFDLNTETWAITLKTSYDEPASPNFIEWIDSRTAEVGNNFSSQYWEINVDFVAVGDYLQQDSEYLNLYTQSMCAQYTQLDVKDFFQFLAANDLLLCLEPEQIKMLIISLRFQGHFTESLKLISVFQSVFINDPEILCLLWEVFLYSKENSLSSDINPKDLFMNALPAFLTEDMDPWSISNWENFDVDNAIWSFYLSEWDSERAMKYFLKWWYRNVGGVIAWGAFIYDNHGIAEAINLIEAAQAEFPCNRYAFNLGTLYVIENQGRKLEWLEIVWNSFKQGFWNAAQFLLDEYKKEIKQGNLTNRKRLRIVFDYLLTSWTYSYSEDDILCYYDMYSMYQNAPRREPIHDRLKSSFKMGFLYCNHHFQERFLVTLISALQKLSNEWLSDSYKWRIKKTLIEIWNSILNELDEDNTHETTLNTQQSVVGYLIWWVKNMSQLWLGDNIWAKTPELLQNVAAMVDIMVAFDLRSNEDEAAPTNNAWDSLLNTSVGKIIH